MGLLAKKYQPKVMVVDDDDMSKLIVTRHFQQLGCHVVHASSARKAMKLLDNSFDLVITDIQMPNKNGIELAEEIRWRYRHVKIIAMTSLEKEEVGGVGMKVFDEVVEKPVLVTECSNIIRAVRATGNN